MIHWTQYFPRYKRPLGYIRLLKARIKFYDYYGFGFRKKFIPWVVIKPGYINKINMLRDQHKGQRCFIIGNGPSIRKMNMSLLKNEITIALNGAYLSFPEWGFDATHMMFLDRFQTDIRGEEISKLKNSVKWLGLDNAHSTRPTKDMYFMHVRNFDQEGYFKSNNWPMFSTDLPFTCHSGRTVTYCAMQLAFHLGCDPVYLIGVDNTYGPYVEKLPKGKFTVTEENIEFVKQAHGIKDYYKIGDILNMPAIDDIETEFRKSREVYESHERTILNAGVDSAVKAFDKVKFADLFK
jgi:hypothetical protein